MCLNYGMIHWLFASSRMSLEDEEILNSKLLLCA
ncbi:hypothetical protein CIPAW_13G005100 [Carya illinoinensis]|uniref:Uncharacterized protein n=1 Tax=Carya illinoinensis TaxID=32201 RepID=A0A8T1NN12_CARIL|nr:hypothetical protein CIPAW_13G005100 [Carya illinoinensis]